MGSGKAGARSKTTVPLCIAILLAATGTPTRAPAPGQSRAAFSVRIDKNVEIPMRDGVVLRADVYRPDAAGRFPALLQRTPYSKNAGSGELSGRLAARRYVIVVQNTRERYTSDGTAIPNDEAEDGYDPVEWVAARPDVNSTVDMFGGSYLATTQLTAASRAPPPPPRRHLPQRLLREPLRHGLTGRRVLSWRWARVVHDAGASPNGLV